MVSNYWPKARSVDQWAPGLMYMLDAVLALLAQEQEQVNLEHGIDWACCWSLWINFLSFFSHLSFVFKGRTQQLHYLVIITLVDSICQPDIFT